jgi:hypothetical protein
VENFKTFSGWGASTKKKIHWQRILGPVCDNEKENWRRLTSKEIYAIVKKNLP